MKRKILISLLAASMAAATGMTAYAGQWIYEKQIWNYQQDDGTLYKNGWQWIDGRCYCFDPAGTMYAGTVTPDGYTVDASGAWTVNGVVQIREQSALDGIQQIVSEVEDADTELLADTLLRAVNEERDEKNRDELLSDQDLTDAAQERAREIAEQFGHTRPDGRTWDTVLDEYGISCSRWGENIAAGQAAAQDVVDQWMDSESHRENMLESRYDYAGVGCYLENGVLYWVMLYAN